MKLSAIQKAFVAVFLANVIWGAAAPIFKISLTNIPTFTLAFWRFFLGAFVLLLFTGKHPTLKFTSRKDFFALVGYAITGITINIIFFFWGLRLTYAINASIIASGAPILTVFLALLFLGERFSLKKFLGMSLGTVGILAIVFEPLLEKGFDGSVLGNFFMVIATVAAVLHTIIGRSILTRVNPILFTFWAFIIGAASFLPLAVYEYVSDPAIYAVLDWRGYMGIVYGAALSSAAGYGLYAWGLAKISATDASIFTYVTPIIGTILGHLVLKEPITGMFVLGSICIFSGIVIAEGKYHYHALPHMFPQLQRKKHTHNPTPPGSSSPPGVADKSRIIHRLFDRKPPSS